MNVANTEEVIMAVNGYHSLDILDDSLCSTVMTVSLCIPGATGRTASPVTRTPRPLSKSNCLSIGHASPFSPLAVALCLVPIITD